MGDERKGPGAMNQESVGEARITPRPTWNTSGQGKDASVPIELDGRWNWAAFLLPTVFAGRPSIGGVGPGLEGSAGTYRLNGTRTILRLFSQLSSGIGQNGEGKG